ncbi:MAG: hypothetical protein AB7N71_07975 [Phycisphaerae bacterium]
MHPLPYRLVVECDAYPRAVRTTPYEDSRKARSDVAQVIRAASRRGQVRCVLLESRENDRWLVTQRWNADVVERILLQDALRDRQQRASHAALQTADLRKPVEWQTRHRSTRYAMATSGAVLLTVICSIFMWQAEGSPIELAHILNDREAAAVSLPFTQSHSSTSLVKQPFASPKAGMDLTAPPSTVRLALPHD